MFNEEKKEKEPRGLVWLPESLVKKIKKTKSETEQSLFINQYLEECKIDMRSSIESLDEDLLIFKAKMLTTKIEFKKAKDEQLDASYKLWEKYQKDLDKVDIKAKKLVEKLNPITIKLENIDKLFSKIQSYHIDSFLKTLQKVAGLYGTEKEMFKFLINNFGDKD